jgi:lipopolysaccharide/colanic/teichoic acid biosynthesis glycosyltransferase
MSLGGVEGVGTADVTHLFGSTLTFTADRPSPWLAFGKRAFDVTVAGTALLVLLPVLIFVAAAVRIALGSGIFYRQVRVGRYGDRFAVIKFRTMHHERRGELGEWYGVERRAVHKSADDPRHTPLGRVLRHWSIDELPQLLNILAGDMSVVGPRPELPHLVATYEEWEHDRHLVRPGLTGLWQVMARGDGTPMRDHARLDVQYARTVSLRTDAAILLRTIRAVGTGS